MSNKIYLQKMFEDPLGSIGNFVATNIKHLHNTLNRLRQKDVRPLLEAEPPERLRAHGLRQRHDGGTRHHRLDQLGVKLGHLEPHHASVAQPHKSAPLHAEPPQRLGHALGLELRRAVGPPRDRPTEE